MKKQISKQEEPMISNWAAGAWRAFCVLTLIVFAAGVSTQAADQPAAGKPARVIRGEPIDAPKPDDSAPAPKPATAAPTNAPASSSSGSSAPAAPSGITNVDAAPTPSKTGGYLTVGFDTLSSYEYTAPDEQVTNLVNGVDAADKFIPANVKKLDGKKAIIKGFMLPLRVEAGKVMELLIMRNQGACCFGVPPKITEIVTVKIPAGKGVNPIMDQPVNMEGTLHVGTMRENGYIVGIYHMDGERLISD